MKSNNLESDFVLKCDVYHKSTEKSWLGNETLAFYKKETQLSGKPLENIVKFFEIIQDQDVPGNSYDYLEKIFEKGNGLVYKFSVVSGANSDAVKRNNPKTFHYYKVIPKLRII